MNKIKDKFKLSIVIVCFNSEKYIEYSIQSVINQTVDLWELIIIDGSSTDSTLNILKKYIDHIGFLISEPDNGIFNAMNKGILKSTGTHICFLNSDDFYREDFVESFYKANCEKDIPFYVSPVNCINECGDQLEQMLPVNNHNDKILASSMPFPHLGLVVRKDVMIKLSCFNERWRYCSDYDFVIRLIKIYGYNYLCLPFALSFFRKGGTSNKIISRLESSRLVLYHFGFIKFLKYFFRAITINILQHIIPKKYFLILRKYFKRNLNYRFIK